MPTTPVAAAGSLTDPVVSDPSANFTRPAATATPAPVLDPPEKWAVSQGFRAGGKGRSKYSPPLPVPYSQVDSLPRQIAPAWRIAVTRSASRSGTLASRRREPAAAGSPAT